MFDDCFGEELFAYEIGGWALGGWALESVGSVSLKLIADMGLEFANDFIVAFFNAANFASSVMDVGAYEKNVLVSWIPTQNTAFAVFFFPAALGVESEHGGVIVSPVELPWLGKQAERK